MDTVVIDGKRYTSEEVQALFLDDDDGDISDAKTIDSNHDSDSDYDIQCENPIPENTRIEDPGPSTVTITDISDQNPVPTVVNSDDEETDIFDGPSRYTYSKNRYKWSKIPPTTGRTRSHNIIVHLPGLKGAARNCVEKTPYSFWNLLIDDDIINIIVECTNEKISELSFSYGNTASFVEHTNFLEIKALFGLLYLTSVFKSNHEDVEGLFANDGTGRDIFRATMSVKRFLFLLAALRFDSVATRNERLNDKLRYISEVFNRFIENCKKCYIPGDCLTVDEMLVGFRGRCSFRVYIKSKPNKYGLKVMCLCDSKTHYLLNAFIYAGKMEAPNPQKLSVPTLSVLNLIDPIKNTGRNITGDNWFTSIELVDKLLAQKLTYVGTVRKNKKEIPSYIIPDKKDAPCSSKFVFTSSKTMVSSVTKQNRYVLLLSSMHHDNKIDDISKKPDIVHFYNSTKSGVDSLDQKCSAYNTGRRTRRWPCAMWYAIMNIASVNSFTLFQAGTDSNMTRRQFTLTLGRSMLEAHMQRRLTQSRLPREIPIIIRKILKLDDESVPPTTEPRVVTQRQQETSRKRRRCYICPSSTDNKYSTVCDTCQNPVCKNHSNQLIKCLNCKKE